MYDVLNRVNLLTRPVCKIHCTSATTAAAAAATTTNPDSSPTVHSLQATRNA